MTAATLSAIRRHAPFDEMDAADLAWMAGRLRLAYYARDARILAPSGGAADRMLVVKQGRVRRADEQGAPAAAASLGPGECFPIAALVAQRAAQYVYAAEEDTFCWELPAAEFRRLLDKSARFRAFCTNRLAVLLERAQRGLRAAAQRSVIDGAGMLAPLSSVLARAPVSCGPQTPVAEVLEAMQRARIGSMLVVDAASAPLGIFTLPDVLARVAVPQAAMSTPIAALMTAKPVTLEAEATLADAAVAMARHGIRHVVVTRDGRLAGVVSERDLFALQRVSLSRTSQRIAGAATPAELVAAAADVRGLARHLLAHGVAAEQLTAMVSALNDALTQRLIALVAARHALPGAWCWLALGSEGRLEQTFATDQDNALIFDTPGAQGAFVAFADEVNRDLAACGFPLCKGGIMAGNPKWCLTAPGWREVFDRWIRNPLPEALLNASIFFDFRPLAGDAALARRLRDAVLAQTRANNAFQRALAETALQTAPPLGLLRDFQLDELDLKIHGVRPFVDAGRVFALAGGSAETSTAARLRFAGEPAAVAAFHYLQQLRLKHQALGGDHERPNRLRVADLDELERRVLKEALRQAARLQARLRLDYRL